MATYEVPDTVKKNDIDLVVIFEPPSVNGIEFIPFINYFIPPLTKEGIPAAAVDPEYLLKPSSERIPSGEPRRFYELCKTRKLVTLAGNNFVFDPKLFNDPELHESLVVLYGKPLNILSHKLSAMKTSAGKPVRLLLCSVHTGFFASNPDTMEDPQILADAAKKFAIPFLDLNDEMTALSLSFFPLTESDKLAHLDPNGHLLMGHLLVHDLIREGYIPMSGSFPSP